MLVVEQIGFRGFIPTGDTLTEDVSLKKKKVGFHVTLYSLVKSNMDVKTM